MMGKNVIIQIISSSISGLITFLTLSLSARLFGPKALGILAYVFGLTGLIFAFSDLGFSQAHIHFTAALKKAGQTLGTFLRFKQGLLLLSSVIAVSAALIIGQEFKGLFVIALLYELSSRYAESILITFEALQLSLPQNLVRLIAKLIKLAAVIFFGLKLATILGYSLTFAAEGLAILLLAYWLRQRFQPLRFDKNIAQKYWHYSLPFFAIIPLSYIQDNSLVVILKQFWPDVEVGYYSASASLAGFIKTLYAAVMIFFFPKISSFFAAKDYKSIQRYTDLAVRYLLLLFLPLFLFLYLLRQEIILIVLGWPFEPAIPVFSLFLLGSFILMLTAPYGYLLYATQNHRPIIRVNVITLILVIGLNLLLVPTLGARAPILASISAWTFSGLAFIYLVRRRLKLRFFRQTFSYIFLACLILISVSQLINYLQPAWLLKLVLVGASIILYLIILYVFKLLNQENIRYFMSLFKLYN